MAACMRSARLHEPGQPLRIDTVEIPEPRPRDVLVQVKACGIIPNMNAIFSGRLWNHLPPLPASVGLDAAGVIAEVGSEVTDVAVVVVGTTEILRNMFYTGGLAGLAKWSTASTGPSTGRPCWRASACKVCCGPLERACVQAASRNPSSGCAATGASTGASGSARSSFCLRSETMR